MARRTGGNRRGPMVKGADQVLQQIKNEVAAQLGVPNYDQLDKGDLPARIHGAIGGSMTKRMVEYAQQAMIAMGGLNSPTNLNFQEFRNDMVQDLTNTEPAVRQ